MYLCIYLILSIHLSIYLSIYLSKTLICICKFRPRYLAKLQDMVVVAFTSCVVNPMIMDVGKRWSQSHGFMRSSIYQYHVTVTRGDF